MLLLVKQWCQFNGNLMKTSKIIELFLKEIKNSDFEELELKSDSIKLII